MSGPGPAGDAGAPAIQVNVNGTRTALVAGELLYALCWAQPRPGLAVACDRMEGHKGRHSWEAAGEDHQATMRT